MTLSLARVGASALVAVSRAGGAAVAQQPQPKKPAAAPAKPAAPAQTPPAAAPQAAPAAQAGQPPAGPVRVELKPSQNEWTKVCGDDPQAGGKKICYTTRDFGQAPDQPPVLAVAVYDVAGDPTKIIRLLLPPGLLLRAGFQLSIDKGAKIDGTFEICFPNGCFAEARVTQPSVDALKKAQVVNIAVHNQFNNEVTFGLPADGFGKAFDGAPIDPKVLEQKQKELQEQVQKQAEEERKKLEQQGGSAAPAAPAK
jgi:invasion protein IalB